MPVLISSLIPYPIEVKVFSVNNFLSKYYYCASLRVSVWLSFSAATKTQEMATTVAPKPVPAPPPAPPAAKNLERKNSVATKMTAREAEQKRQELLTMVFDEKDLQQHDNVNVELNLDNLEIANDDGEWNDLDDAVISDDVIERAKSGVNLRDFAKANEDLLVKIEMDSIDDCTGVEKNNIITYRFEGE